MNIIACGPKLLFPQISKKENEMAERKREKLGYLLNLHHTLVWFLALFSKNCWVYLWRPLHWSLTPSTTWPSSTASLGLKVCVAENYLYTFIHPLSSFPSPLENCLVTVSKETKNENDTTHIDTSYHLLEELNKNSKY